MIHRITSRSNNEIKEIASLLKDRAARRATGLFIAEGIRPITTLIESKVKVKKLYVLENEPELIEAAKNLCLKNNLDNAQIITFIPSSVLEKITHVSTPSGILGVFHIPHQKNTISLDDGIVLADITSPGNMGTMIRTAAALNIKNIIIINGTDAWSPKVVQASAGTIGMVTIIECSWQELLAKKGSVPLCALVVSGGEAIQNLKQEKILFVVGNEAHGLPEKWIESCEHTITLPMPGKTESLNAALAASIALYVRYLYKKTA